MPKAFGSTRFLTIFGVLLLTGCGEAVGPAKLPETVPFSGVVKIDGAPMNRGIITFIPKSDGGYNAVGFVNEKGEYKLKTSVGELEGDGAAPGDYKVTISRFVKPSGEPQDPSVPAEIPGKESIPLAYSDATVSALTAVVPAGGGTKDFEVSTK